MRRMRHAGATGAAVLNVLALGGCLERTMHITSDPPGALVILNDVEVGRTPVEVDFEWYGTYDVRLSLPGHEPLVTSAEAKAPAHELPGLDLVALVLPVRFKNDVRWHFTLTPAPDDPDGAIERGRELRTILGPQTPDAATADPAAPAPPGGPPQSESEPE